MVSKQAIAALEERELTDDEISMLVEYDTPPRGGSALVSWQGQEVRIHEPVSVRYTRRYLYSDLPTFGELGAAVGTEQEAREAWESFKERRLAVIRS